MLDIGHPRFSAVQDLDIKLILAIELGELSLKVRDHKRVDVVWSLRRYEAIERHC